MHRRRRRLVPRRGQPLLRYTVPDPDETDRRRPATVPEGDRDFGPERTPPDNPIDDWPVFLGSVTRRRQGEQDTYTIDSDGRPYAGLVGEEIRAPSGRASVQVGAEQSDDPFRFAVRVADLGEVPRLAVLAVGGVVVVGETSLLGNVTVGGVVDLKQSRTRATCRCLRAAVDHLARRNDADNHELRMQMDGPHGSANHEVVIGTWTMVTQDDGSQEQQFSPCLTIGSEGNVTVHGDLVVEGDLLDKARNIRQLGDSALSDSAEAMANAAFHSGMGITSGIVEAFYEPQPGPPESPR